MKIPNWLLSSTGEGVALRWRGFFSAIVPITLLVAPLLGVEGLDNDSLLGFGKSVEIFILSVWAASSAIASIVGFGRQLKYKRERLGKYSRTGSY